MANVDNVHGFRPLNRTLSGGSGAALVECNKVVGYGTALFIGDAITRVASGLLITPTISAAITPGTTPTYGVNLTPGAASTATNHLVIPTGNLQIFEAQIDTAAVADVNKNAAIVMGAGSATTQLSGHSLNGVATTNTLDCKLHGFLRVADNAAGAFARMIVTFNRNMLVDQLAGI